MAAFSKKDAMLPRKSLFAFRKQEQTDGMTDATIPISVNVTNCRLKCVRLSRALSKNVFTMVVFLFFLCNFPRPTNTASSAELSMSFDRARLKRRADTFGRGRHRSTCEHINIALCEDIGYNLTNLALSPSNLDKRDEAELRVNEYKPLLKTGCAEEMKLLVCAVYTPVCMPSYLKFMPPCRYICEKAKKGCGHYFEEYGVDWPELFKCENFPVFTGENQMCLHFNRSQTAAKKSTLSYPRSIESPRISTGKPTKTPVSSPNVTLPIVSAEKVTKCRCSCHPPLVPITQKNDRLYNKVETGLVNNCAMPCRSPYFNQQKMQFAETWITVWSVVCFVVTLLSVSTFLIDANRFKYPERPVIFLSACYLFVSIGFLIRVVAGHEAVACAWQSDVVLYKTTGPFLCSIVFLLVYFFGMASALWWVILSLTWFLAAGLKWGSEAIASYSQYFHGAAWFFPAVQSILVLVTSSVDGDPLAGICYVGNQDTKNLAVYVLVPLMVYLGVGGLFLCLGFVYLVRIRKSMQKGGKKTNTLEKLMGRIGLFSLLYMIPSALLIACHFYEHHNRERWAITVNCKDESGKNCELAEPDFAVFILKYFATLLTGITNVVWVCTGKTIVSWKNFYRKCRICICMPMSMITWFKQRRMKRNLSDQSTIVDAEVLKRTSSNQTSCESRGDNGTLRHSLEEVGIAETARHDFSSRADSTINCSHALVSSTGTRSHSSISSEKQRDLGKCRRTSTGTSTKADHCCYLCENNHKRNVNDSVESSDGDDNYRHCSVTSEATDAVFLPLYRKTSKTSSRHCCSCGPDSCQSSLLLAYPSKTSSARSSAHKRFNPIILPAEVDTQPCFVYCQQSGTLTVVERSSPGVQETEDASRIQHIHHHHHHHVASESSCQCNRKGRSRKTSCHRHSSESTNSKTLSNGDPQNKRRIIASDNRTSPISITSLRR